MSVFWVYTKLETVSKRYSNQWFFQCECYKNAWPSQSFLQLVCDFLYFLFFCSFVCHNKPPYFHFLHNKRQPALDCLLHNICYLLLVTKLLSNSILLIAIYSCLLSIIDNYHEYICLWCHTHNITCPKSNSTAHITGIFIYCKI